MEINMCQYMLAVVQSKFILQSLPEGYNLKICWQIQQPLQRTKQCTGDTWMKQVVITEVLEILKVSEDWISDEIGTH